MNKVFVLSLTFLWSWPTVAEDQALAGLFTQQRLDGTMVISSLHDGQNFIHNDLRANQRFSTASTFKIMNTLIALEENAISGKDEVLKWNGQIYDFPDWNHDQTLESAFSKVARVKLAEPGIIGVAKPRLPRCFRRATCLLGISSFRFPG